MAIAFFFWQVLVSGKGGCSLPAISQKKHRAFEKLQKLHDISDRFNLFDGFATNAPASSAAPDSAIRSEIAPMQAADGRSRTFGHTH